MSRLRMIACGAIVLGLLGSAIGIPPFLASAMISNSAACVIHGMCGTTEGSAHE